MKYTPDVCCGCGNVDWELGGIEFTCQVCLQVECFSASVTDNEFPVYAQAPKMYELLKRLESSVCTDSSFKELDSIRDEIRAIIRDVESPL